MKQLVPIALCGLALAPPLAWADGPKAKVFIVNPVVDNEKLSTVLLDELPADAKVLRDHELQVVSCIDRRTCRSVKTIAGVRDVHFCETESLVQRGADGTFLHVKRGKDADAKDGFAEVQGYFHAKTALRAFREWAEDPTFKLKNPLTIIVNYQPPDLAVAESVCQNGQVQPESELLREDNAYFWPKGDIGPVDLGDRVLLGQGEKVDWAYDGEVVYHEMVHALMHTLTPLAWFNRDSLGIDYTLGGLHEGFSDYLAATITGNPRGSLYAGTTENGPEPLGDLEAFAHCRDGQTGEEHTESVAFSNALWMIRRSLRSQAKRLMFDRSLFRSLTALEKGTGMKEAVEIILAELDKSAEDFIKDEALNPSEAELLRSQVGKAKDKFTERGLPGCGDRIVPLAVTDRHPELYVRGPNTLGTHATKNALGPAGVQFRIELAAQRGALTFEADSSFTLTFEQVGPGMHEQPDLRVLVKPGTKPIHWTWDKPRGVHDAPQSAKLVIDETGRARATLAGTFPAGTYHVQVVNAGADWGLEQFGLAGDRPPAPARRSASPRRHFRSSTP